MDLRGRHPLAGSDLVVPITTVSPVSHEQMLENARINGALDLPWLDQEVPAHEGTAVIVGKGPSLKDTLHLVRRGKIFACNSVAKHLVGRNIFPDYQVMLDSHPAMLDEIGPARAHLFSSTVDPFIVKQCSDVLLWHPLIPEIETVLPPRPFVGIGGGVTVLNSALALAHTMGFRKIEVHGADSSYRNGDVYAFDSGQPIEPLKVTVERHGVLYETSVDMKEQARVFMSLVELFKQAGTQITVFGSGLLPDLMKESYGR